ncbi:hypothetical protein BH09SUM1_BH09SUM1_28960 [soil metagenome]
MKAVQNLFIRSIGGLALAGLCQSASAQDATAALAASIHGAMLSTAELRVVDAPAGKTSAASARLRGVAQIIGNQFYHWEEYPADAKGGDSRYVVMLAPEAHGLSAIEAQVLLSASASWEDAQSASTAGAHDDGFTAEKWSSRSAGEKTVFGPDDRVRMTANTSNPNNLPGLIQFRFPNTPYFRGTAFLVSPYVALTAGHCVYDTPGGGYLNAGNFSPGLSQPAGSGVAQNISRPFGTLNILKGSTNPAWIANNSDSDNDYGAVMFNNQFSGISTFAPVVFGEALANGAALTLFGYPGDVQGEGNSYALWRSAGTLAGANTTPFQYRYNNDTTEGNSGGPLLDSLGNMIGIHVVGGTSTNGGVRFTAANEALITSWMKFAPAGATHVDVGVLTPGTDFWVAQGQTNNAFAAPFRTGTYGFKFDINVKWQGLTGDFDGDGLDDIATVNDAGELYTAKNTGGNFFDPVTKQSAGWKFDPDTGWRTFPGDFNGDGKTDILMITQYTDKVWVGLSSPSGTAGPSPAGSLGFKYNPTAGYWIGVADVNGDGRDDIIQSTAFKDAWVALATPAGAFVSATKWGVTGFKWDFTNHFGLVAGDFSGDGKADLAQVTPYGDVWIVTSTGTAFSAPTRWGVPGFRDAYRAYDGNNFSAFAADIDRDGKDDLVQLTDAGEIWAAFSTGTALSGGSKLAELGFKHNEVVGRWQVFLGNFSNVGNAKAVGAEKDVNPVRTPAAAQQLTPTPSLTPTPEP